jgi:hypothetical protein
MAATVRIKNVGPFARDIRPGGAFGETLAAVEPGAEVEVGAALAASLLEQVDVWQPVDAKAAKSEKGTDA